jgi:hypothetical protein
VRSLDWAVVGTLGLMLAMMPVLASALGVDPLVALLVAATMALTTLSLVLHRQVRRAQREQLQATANSVSQIEALFSIFATLQPTVPLPPLGGWAASPDLLRLLLDVVLRERPQVVLEASSGATTLVLAYALKRVGAGGRLVSLEDDPEHAERTRESLAVAGLQDVATVIHAPLVEHQLEGTTWRWYDLSNLPELLPVGLLVVDGPPGTVQRHARYPALPLLLDRLAPTATVVMDDVRRTDERTIASRWHSAFPGWQVEFPPTEKGAAIFRRSATTR